MSIFIREGVVIPHLRLGRFEIGGGIFPYKTSTKFIIKSKEIEGLEDPLYSSRLNLPISSSIGFKGFRIGIYIKYYHG